MHLAICSDLWLLWPHSLPVSLLIYRLACVLEIASKIKTGTVKGYENAYQDNLTNITASARANLLIWSLQTVDSDQNPWFRYVLWAGLRWYHTVQNQFYPMWQLISLHLLCVLCALCRPIHKCVANSTPGWVGSYRCPINYPSEITRGIIF